MNKMNNKKGFTLIELLAVIAILSILLIIAIPGVLEMYNNAKEDTFIDQARSIYNTAQKQYLSDQMGSASDNVRYCHDSTGTGTYENALEISGNTKVYYDISFSAGKVVSFTVTDGAMEFKTTGASIDSGDIIKTAGSGYTTVTDSSSVDCSE